MSKPFRAFLAVDLSEDLRGELSNVQRQLRDADPGKMVRWVEPRLIHLTIKFLGQVDEERVPSFIIALEEAVERVSPFHLTARGLGSFPNTRRPNTLWVALEGDIAAVKQLARRVEVTSLAHGFPADDQEFVPHLTLGRVRREASPAQRAEIGARIRNFPRSAFGSIGAEELHLISSDLRPSGPIYKRLAKVKLKPRDD